MLLRKIELNLGENENTLTWSKGVELTGDIELFLLAGVEVGEYDAGMFCGYAGGWGL